MKHLLIFSTVLFLFMNTGFKQLDDNPLLSPYNTPFNVPPFDKIKVEHYIPAFKAAMEQQQQTIQRIIDQKAIPDFGNTIEEFENSNILLSEVNGVFSIMQSVNSTKELQEVSKEIAPLLSRHTDDILMNKRLFEKIEEVYKQRVDHPQERLALLENIYRRFIRGGAALNDENKAKLKKINEELSLLSLKFGDNLLAETNGFKLWIDKKEDLAGLPQGMIDGGYEAAKKAGQEGKWLFTLHNPSLMPFLTYADNRALREKIWNEYKNRGNNPNDKNNNEVITKIINLRLERAKLLGFKSHADYVLDDNMAKKPEKVMDFLNKLWTPANNKAKAEADELQKLIDKEGGNFKLQPWDWRYYAEKLRKEKYDLDETMLTPYFELENVKSGIFYLSNKLYGITFKELSDMPMYNDEIKYYEVLDSDNSHLGILIMDYFPRSTKRGGAWMNNYREQYKIDGVNIPPVITICGNFSRPTANEPALLTLDEVETFFHEFGHSLHGLLSKCTYKSISGTNVARDFVEMPSQIMENWVTQPELLAVYAKHYKTGEVIPLDLVKKITNSSLFNQGFATTEYLAASILDMKFHTLTENLTTEPLLFEDAIMNELGLIPDIISRYKSTYFNHIFNSEYSAGYYSYIWAAVLDADAFEAFKENGIFDKTTAMSFRHNILEKGGTKDPMILYKKFRGHEPDIKPLLKRRGLN